MDPLSEVLSLLKPQSHVSSGFDAGGDWSLHFAIRNDVMKCYSVVSGTCWLKIDEIDAPLCLEAGDCFVLPSGRPFRLASDLDLTPTDSKAAFPPTTPGGVVTLNGGGGLFLVGSRFTVSGQVAGSLLRMLPPVVHLRCKDEQAALRWSIDRMREEIRSSQPGGHLISQHLAHMMLVQALRLHLAEQQTTDVGWFAALADNQIGAAIAAVHAEPAKRWTLSDLAKTVGMSRSVFAHRFKEKLGETPMDYVTRWRMLLAVQRLENSNDPISAIAPDLGYESEGAFSTAFKRVMGRPPRAFRNGSPASMKQTRSATPLFAAE
ncbi:AraC family transcriptional regulator [Agrobacterium sp. a22-2]|uniref:AraC family transcriptional regulator n=1 Tax=Agrobacterium sp. a22-2 TaxID=2283840 RepID=UPI0014457A1E|nr:AraC family transcriptional regulator [Agrobacterium sp. a22-2]NKN37324.1 AraC family transcriptional regulator [Agrobacterium sp. a22-2]